MTTTATERPTLSVAEAHALPVGTRVEWRQYNFQETPWRAGVIADPDTLVTHGGGTERNRYALVKNTDADSAGWADGGQGNYWWIDSPGLVRLADAFYLGQRVTATVDGGTFSGVIRGHYAPEHAPHSWLVCDDSLPSGYPVYASNNPRSSVATFTYADGYPEGGERGVWVREENLRDLTSAPTPVASDDAARILRIIGESLAETADRHEWCGEYESHLSRLVAALPAGELRDTFEQAASRETDSDFEVEVSYTITGTHTVVVTARDSESAEEMVREDPWSYIDSYSLRSGVSTDDVEFDGFEAV